MHIGKSQVMPLIVVAAATGIVLLLKLLDDKATGLNLLETLEASTYDSRVRLSTNSVPNISTNLGNVFVGDDSLRVLADKYSYFWPLPRLVYGKVIGELNAQGASVIGLDILLGELQSCSECPPIKLPSGDLVASDEYLAHQLSQQSNVVLAASPGVVPPEMFRNNALAIGEVSRPDEETGGILRRGAVFRKYRIWHPQLRTLIDEYTLDADSAEIHTNKIIIPQFTTSENQFETNNKVTIPLYEGGQWALEDFFETGMPPGIKTMALPFEDVRVWHLGIQLAARALGLDLENAVIEPRQIILNGPDGLRRVIPTDGTGEDRSFYINWKLAWNDSRIKVSGIQDLLEAARLREAGEQVENNWNGKIVVIGATGTGQNVADFGATPLRDNDYLMGTYANVANMLLSDTFIRRSSTLIDFLLLLLMPIVLLLLRIRFRGIVHSLLVFVVGVCYVATAVTVFYSSGYWLPIVVPILALVVPQFALVSYEVFFEENEKRRVKDVFSKLVSPNVVHELLSTDHLNFGGQLKNITVMFSDVRGFTMMTDDYHKRAETFKAEHPDEPEKVKAFSDQMAQESLANVNTYLGVISNMVKKHNGTLDKYMGDCVMAFWGAPTDNDQHALSCVRAAIDSQRAMYKINLDRMAENNRRKKLNEEREKNGEEPLDLLRLLALGSGINSGVSIVGLMGSNEHILNYTVFGREVNLASRLEGVSGRGRVVIGENTYNEIKRYAPEFLENCKPLEPVMVKGISTPVNIYEVPWKENWDELAALKAES